MRIISETILKVPFRGYRDGMKIKIAGCLLKGKIPDIKQPAIIQSGSPIKVFTY